MIKKISNETFTQARFKRTNTNIIADIEEFVASGDNACEVVTDDYKTIRSAYAAYKASARRSGYPINIMTRGKRLFMYQEVA